MYVSETHPTAQQPEPNFITHHFNWKLPSVRVRAHDETVYNMQQNQDT